MQWILHDIPIGRNIRNIRVRKNMTQLELVTKNAVDGKQHVEKYLSKYRNRQKKCKSKRFESFKNYFGCWI